MFLNVTTHNEDETLFYNFGTRCRKNKHGYERSVNKHLILKEKKLFSLEINTCLIDDQGEQFIIQKRIQKVTW